MKVSLLQQDLLPHLQAVSRSVGIRSTLPVLDNILFSTDGLKLKIAATNLEIGVIKLISAQILEPGEITIPAKTMVEIIAGLKVDKVELETSGEILTITSGKFKASVNGISASEFPVIPQGSGDGINLKKDVILSTAQILFAAAVDEGRPQLTGILTENSDKKFTFVSTDGFRLAYRQVEVGENNKFRSLIPKKTFEEVIRVIGEEGVDDVKLSTSGSQNQIVFTIGQTVISSRLIEGNFPAWQRIIPKEIKARVLVEKSEILKAAKLAAIFAKSEGYIVLKLTKERLIIESNAKELGSQQNEVEAIVEGEELVVAFNAKFLTESLSNIPTTQLSMEFSGSLTATIVKPIGLMGLEFIIMPMKIN